MKHTGEKPFQCEICSFATAKKSYLTVHTKIHTVGEKPFKCGVCRYATSNKYDLTRHIRVHTGDIPY